jgi:spore germination protein YaaH
MQKRIGALNPIYLEDWNVVRNYKDFVEAVTNHIDEITHVSFDHDLADIHYDPTTWREGFVYQEETGHDCAVWLKNFYKERGKELPILFVHSMNPVGTQNIINVFK